MSLFIQSDDESYRNTQGSQHQLILSPPKERSKAPNITFDSSTNQITHLSEIFQSLSSISNHAIVNIKSNGIIISSNYNSILSTSINIDSSLFIIYNLTGEEQNLKFGIDLNLINECFLSVINTLKFEKNVKCVIKYQGSGYPLVIEFEDLYISEKLEFYTYYVNEDEDEDEEDISIDYANLQMEIILKSDILYNLLQDLNQISTENLFIYISKNESNPKLHFISQGIIGNSKLIFPNDKLTMEKYKIFKTDKFDFENYIISKFTYSNFFKILKSVKMSNKCKLIKDIHGCLSIQLLCKNNNNNENSSTYNGSLITINMMELNYDDDKFMINWILNDEIEEDKVPEINDEPLINTFRREPSPLLDVERSIYEESSKKRKNTKVGGAVEIPLFL
ncbi:unnamed protein product [Candida verbasci]|uniref:DNA damage checkpoint control protein RAD17 n=1 Tax=Candida verbasci TaxID=1227364 RepID=A0A9W4TWH8_9ASCO|nr:unnamed protein product [Candida verbasci]